MRQKKTQNKNGIKSQVRTIQLWISWYNFPLNGPAIICKCLDNSVVRKLFNLGVLCKHRKHKLTKVDLYLWIILEFIFIDMLHFA